MRCGRSSNLEIVWFLYRQKLIITYFIAFWNLYIFFLWLSHSSKESRWCRSALIQPENESLLRPSCWTQYGRGWTQRFGIAKIGPLGEGPRFLDQPACCLPHSESRSDLAWQTARHYHCPDIQNWKARSCKVLAEKRKRANVCPLILLLVLWQDWKCHYVCCC